MQILFNSGESKARKKEKVKLGMGTRSSREGEERQARRGRGGLQEIPTVMREGKITHWLRGCSQGPLWTTLSMTNTDYVSPFCKIISIIITILGISTTPPYGKNPPPSLYRV